MTRKIGIIVQARLSSTRLPKKIILEIDQEQSFLDIQLKKLQQLKDFFPIILATSESENDAVLEQYATKYGFKFFQGSEHNVLKRFIDCSEENNLQAVIRICSDNPYIDIDSLKELYHTYKNEDYLSFSIDGTPAILTHYGFFCEIVSLDALKRVYHNNNKECLEHVTNCIYKNSKEFGLKFIQKSIQNKNVRCTLDTREDFENLKYIYMNFVKENSHAGYLEIIKFIEEDLQLLKRMKKIIKENSK